MPALTTKTNGRAKQFDKSIRELWESYNLVQFYAKDLTACIKQDEFKAMPIKNLEGGATKQMTKAEISNALATHKEKICGRTTFLTAWCLFEEFLGELAHDYWMAHPEKLQATWTTRTKGSAKLMTIMLECANKQEMMERLVDDKICKAFHANFLEIFTADKLGLGFGDHFTTECKTEFAALTEIWARRHALIWNNGKIDKAYTRTVTNTRQSAGNNVTIDTAYLFNCLQTLCTIAGEFAKQLSTGTTAKAAKAPAKGKLAKRIKQKPARGKVTEIHQH